MILRINIIYYLSKEIMTKIEISDELYEKLINISKELNNQDHLCTAMPYLFQIKDYKKVSCHEDYGDDFELIDEENDSNEIDTSSIETIIQYLKENDMYDELKEEIDEIIEDNKDYEYWNYIVNETIDILVEKYSMTKFYYQEIETFSNWFFTRKEAEDFLKSNSYHFTEKAHIYLNYLSRNDEMKSIITFLCELSWWKLHL